MLARMTLAKNIAQLEKGIYKISRLAFYIGISMVIVLIVLTIADILARLISSSSIKGVRELSQYAVGILVFLGIQYCVFKGTHIVVDILVIHFSPRKQAWVDAVVYLLSWIMCGLASWQLFLYALRAAGDNVVSPLLEIWVFPFILVGAAGFFLGMLSYLIRWIRSLKESRS